MGIKCASELGYDGIELSLRDPSEVDASRIQDCVSALGLRVCGIATGQAYYNDRLSLYTLDNNRRRQAITRLKRHIDLAAQVDAMVILGGIRGRLENGSKREEQIAVGKAAMCEVCSYGLSKDVTLLLEPINRYETNIINTIAEGIDLIDELEQPNLKLLADTFHMNIEEASPVKALESTTDYLGYVHFADNNRLAPGWGNVDFDAVYQALRCIGFDGPIGIEILPKPGDREASAQAIRFLDALIASK